MNDQNKNSANDTHTACHSPCLDCNNTGFLENKEVCPSCGGTGCKDRKSCLPAGGLDCEI